MADWFWLGVRCGCVVHLARHCSMVDYYATRFLFRPDGMSWWIKVRLFSSFVLAFCIVSSGCSLCNAIELFRRVLAAIIVVDDHPWWPIVCWPGVRCGCVVYLGRRCSMVDYYATRFLFRPAVMPCLINIRLFSFFFGGQVCVGRRWDVVVLSIGPLL